MCKVHMLIPTNSLSLPHSRLGASTALAPALLCMHSCLRGRYRRIKEKVRLDKNITQFIGCIFIVTLMKEIVGSGGKK